MTQEDKESILKDLCARLPYDVKVCYEYDTSSYYYLNEISPACREIMISAIIQDENRKYCAECVLLEEIKPYLRSMSSMTAEEKKEYGKVCELDTEILAKHPMNGEPFPALYNSQDWLNKNHFDYRGLIKKGLALEAPKEMYI